jgi:hypothetical protein
MACHGLRSHRARGVQASMVEYDGSFIGNLRSRKIWTATQMSMLNKHVAGMNRPLPTNIKYEKEFWVNDPQCIY